VVRITVSEAGRSGTFPARSFGLLNDSHDVTLLHDQKVFVIDPDLGPGPFAEQDEIARLDVERDQLAAFVAGTWADGDDLAFLRVFFRGRSEERRVGKEC